MVALGSAGGDQFVAYANRKWQVGPSAAVQMAQLAAADAKFDAAKTVRRDRHLRPRRHFTNDPLLDALRRILPRC